MCELLPCRHRPSRTSRGFQALAVAETGTEARGSSGKQWSGEQEGWRRSQGQSCWRGWQATGGAARWRRQALLTMLQPSMRNPDPSLWRVDPQLKGQGAMTILWRPFLGTQMVFHRFPSSPSRIADLLCHTFPRLPHRRAPLSCHILLLFLYSISSLFHIVPLHFHRIVPWLLLTRGLIAPARARPRNYFISEIQLLFITSQLF